MDCIEADTIEGRLYNQWGARGGGGGVALKLFHLYIVDFATANNNNTKSERQQKKMWKVVMHA